MEGIQPVFEFDDVQEFLAKIGGVLAISHDARTSALRVDLDVLRAQSVRPQAMLEILHAASESPDQLVTQVGLDRFPIMMGNLKLDACIHIPGRSNQSRKPILRCLYLGDKTGSVLNSASVAWFRSIDLYSAIVGGRSQLLLLQQKMEENSLSISNRVILHIIPEVADRTADQLQLLAANVAFWLQMFRSEMHRQLSRIASLQSQIIAEEERAVSTRLALLETKHRGLQGAPSNEKAALSVRLQQVKEHFRELENGLSERIDAYFSQHRTGGFVERTSDFISELVILDTEKRGKQLIWLIPKDFEDRFQSYVEAELKGITREQCTVFEDNQEVFTRQFVLELDTNGISLPRLPQEYLTFEEADWIVRQACLDIEQYESRTMRVGGYQLFMSIRRYQMVIFMMFGSFGMSFMNGMRQYMLPISGLLLLFGAVSVFRSANSSAKLTKAEELGKARKFLFHQAQQAAERMMRSWSKVLQDKIRSQANLSDIFFREHLGRLLQVRQDAVQQSMRTVQEQKNSLMQKEKKLRSAMATVSAIQVALANRPENQCYSNELRN